MMNKDCILIQTQEYSYRITSSSNSIVFGTLTPRSSCADTSFECIQINMDSIPIEDITYKLSFNITYNPLWSNTDMMLQQTVYESLISTFSITLGQFNAAKVSSSIPMLSSPQILSSATKEQPLISTNRLLFHNYIQHTTFPIAYHVSSSESNLLGLTSLPQPTIWNATHLQIELEVSFSAAIPTFYIYGGIQETTNYFSHAWVTDVFYTMFKVEVPKFQCSNCSHFVIDDSYTARQSDDYDTFELSKISMLSQANIIFTSLDSTSNSITSSMPSCPLGKFYKEQASSCQPCPGIGLEAHCCESSTGSYNGMIDCLVQCFSGSSVAVCQAQAYVQYYYKPYGLELYSDESLLASSKCIQSQADCYATVDAATMNLQYWHVPRNNQTLYLKAIAHDQSEFSRKVTASIYCDISPKSITQQKLMPSYGIEQVEVDMIHQSLDSMMSSYCATQSSRLNSTNTTRIAQEKTTRCSKSDTACFHVDIQEPINIQIFEYDMEFTIDYVGLHTSDPLFTTDLAILDFYTLPSLINVTIGQRDWKDPSISLRKINRGLDPIPEYIFLLNSKPQLTPSNVIDFPLSQAFTVNKTIFYNISKSDCNLTSTNKISAFLPHPLDPNKLRLEINTDYIYEEQIYVYSAVKEYDTMGFTTEIFFDLTPVLLKTKCGDLYYKGKIFSVCENFFYNEPPRFEDKEPTKIQIGIEKDVCSQETTNLHDKYVYLSSKVFDKEGDNIYGNCDEIPLEAKEFATVGLNYQGKIEISLDKEIMRSLGSKVLKNFEVRCRLIDKSVTTYKKHNFEEFRVEVQFTDLDEGNFGGIQEAREKTGLNISFFLESQDNKGNICINTGFTVTKSKLLEEMQAVYGVEPDDLSFVSSETEEFRDQLFVGEISHDYEIFDLIEDKHDFGWKITKTVGASICLQLLFENPLVISFYGLDIMSLELDLEGKRGMGLYDLFKFTPIVKRALDEDNHSGNQEDGQVTIQFELNKQETEQMDAINEFFKVAFKGIASASAKSVATQFVINFVLIKSFSKLNSYMMTLQLIVYSCFLLDLWFPERIEFTLQIMLKVCGLDFIADEYVELFFKILSMSFNEQNEAPEKLQALGIDSISFFSVLGSITIYVVVEIIFILSNELILRPILLLRKKLKTQKDSESKGEQNTDSDKKDRLQKWYDHLSHQTLFSSTYEILDSCIIDITIAIIVCLRSNAYQMEENGEVIGYTCSIILTIVYSLWFWATYKTISRVSQKAELFNRINSKCSSAPESINLQQSQNQQVQKYNGNDQKRGMDIPQAQTNNGQSIEKISFKISKIEKKLKDMKSFILDVNLQIHQLSAKIDKRQNSSTNLSFKDRKYIYGKKAKLKEIRKEGVRVKEKREALKQQKIGLQNQASHITENNNLNISISDEVEVLNQEEIIEQIEEYQPQNEKVQLSRTESSQKGADYTQYDKFMTPEKYSFLWRFDIVIQDLKTHKGVWLICFKPVWTLRRLVILALGMSNAYGENLLTPVMQIQVVILANFFHGIYITSFKPFIDKQQLQVEQFNTLIFYSLSVLLLFYTKSASFDEDGIYQAPVSAFFIDTAFRTLFLIFTTANLAILIRDQMSIVVAEIRFKIYKGNYQRCHKCIRWYRSKRFCFQKQDIRNKSPGLGNENDQQQNIQTNEYLSIERVEQPTIGDFFTNAGENIPKSDTKQTQKIYQETKVISTKKRQAAREDKNEFMKIEDDYLQDDWSMKAVKSSKLFSKSKRLSKQKGQPLSKNNQY